jgi:hypothetical protein
MRKKGSCGSLCPRLEASEVFIYGRYCENLPRDGKAFQTRASVELQPSR